MTPADRIRLLHMLDYARSACRFLDGRSRADLAADDMLRMAVIHAVQVGGEAAFRVTTDGRNELDDIPWGLIIGMRHRLVHGYMDIDDEVLWVTVTERLPPLIERLRAVPDLREP